MSNHRLLNLWIMLGLFLSLSLAACTSQAEAPSSAITAPTMTTEAPSLTTADRTATLVQKVPITLRLAVSDAEYAPSGPSVQKFVDLVRELSDGNIIIEPVWEAGEDTTADFEQGVIAAVKSGEYDLGLAGSRAFDLEGVNAFKALQTPFLIDSDALAIAVAESDVAVRMLDKISTQGLTGLTLWPEDLRHPFSVVAGKPLITPDDFAGENIRSTPSGISYALIDAFGGKPVFGNSNYQGAESGLRQGFSLTGQPIATGNVIFFPKYQVLFANKAAFDKLRDAQRAILREAAAETQKKAITERPSEVEAGATWCAENGTIVLASKEQIAAFEKAARPVLALIEQDPENAELITAIRELKAKTLPSPGVEACGSEVAQQSPTQDQGTQTWSGGLPPNGVWQVKLSNDDVIGMGVSKTNAPDWSGIFTSTFQDGDYSGLWEGTEGRAAGQTASCKGTYEVVDNFVRITYTEKDACEGETDDIQWRLDDEGLHFHLVANQNGPFVELRAVYEAMPYQKVADK
jgi:TRAP-type C4-dicarboxylate transport system substrate-binding protein